jgi:hypothetical protein
MSLAVFTSEAEAEAKAGSRRRRRHIAPAPIHRDPTRRAVFGTYGCTVYGWPSKGGVIIRRCADAVELEYLGFNRFDPPAKRCADQDEEDKFCTALLKIGGKWWSSEERSMRTAASDGTADEPTDQELKEVFVGWPDDGGVLIAEFQNEIGEDKVPEDIGRLRMAFTMEQRCEMLTNHFGARYFRDWRRYEGYAKLEA